MATKYNTSANYKRKEYFREYNSGKSLTLPGQSMSIRQILNRSLEGIAPDMARKAIYLDSQDFDDIDLSKVQGMDLVELQQLRMRMKEKIAELYEQTQAKEKEDEKKDLETEKTAPPEVPET